MLYRIETLSADRAAAMADTLVAVSADVSPWRAGEILAALPDKWRLSFTIGGPVGIAGYAILSTRFGPPHIHQFMVAAALRGRGIGAVMLAEAIERGAATLKVAAENGRAIAFYERHAWRADRAERGYLWMRAPIAS